MKKIHTGFILSNECSSIEHELDIKKYGKESKKSCIPTAFNYLPFEHGNFFSIVWISLQLLKEICENMLYSTKNSNNGCLYIIQIDHVSFSVVRNTSTR